MGLSFIFFPFIENILGFYFARFLYGLGIAFNLISWRKLFARNLHKGKEGISYSLYDVFFSLSTAGISAAGALLSLLNPDQFITFVFIAGVFIIINGSIWPFMIYKTKNRLSRNM